MTIERPRYHFSPPEGWLNDPNGLIYYQGEYHMFYQWCSMLKVDSHYMCWAHAVSSDLMHWTHLPLSLEPDELGAIWSGSAVDDARNSSGGFTSGGGLVAIFTHHSRADAERQSIAFSADRGRTWTKYAKNPVLGGESDRDFRDPKVFWYEPTQRWVMIVGVKHRLYESVNLRDWTLLGETGFKSECPDLFSIGVEGSTETKWFLSLGGREYVVGHFDGKSFRAESAVLPVETGPDFYATQSWENVPGGRRLWIGWVNNWKYAREVPDFGALGFMSVPREMILRRVPDVGLRLVQRPVAEMASLRKEAVKPSAEAVNGQTSFMQASSFELEAELLVGQGDRCGFKVRLSDREETLVGYDAAAGCAFIDRERSGLKVTSGRCTSPLALRNGRIKLRCLVDTLSVEAFFDDGATVLSVQVYPDAVSTGVAWFSEKKNSSAESVNAWKL